MAFHRFKDMDLIEEVHIFGLSDINNFELNITLIRLFSLIINCAKPRMLQDLYPVRQTEKE